MLCAQGGDKAGREKAERPQGDDAHTTVLDEPARVRGVRVGASPEWLATRLRAVGLRPINNVVDATNFVLHELGQPLHAFDLDALAGAVVVRRATAGERLTTLDGQDRALDPTDLLITDGSGPIALAGVMGGGPTEIARVAV